MHPHTEKQAYTYMKPHAHAHKKGGEERNTHTQVWCVGTHLSSYQPGKLKQEDYHKLEADQPGLHSEDLSQSSKSQGNGRAGEGAVHSS